MIFSLHADEHTQIEIISANCLRHRKIPPTPVFASPGPNPRATSAGINDSAQQLTRLSHSFICGHNSTQTRAMALTHDVNGFDPSSPHSSCGGAESFKGTPDTRLTSFSPDEKPAKTSCITELTGKPWAGTKPSQFPVGIVGKTPSIGDKDPFVTVYSRARTTSLLSPTASAFHPFSAQSELSEGLTNSMSTSRGSNASNLASHESSIPQFVQIMSPGHALRLGDIISYLEVVESMLPPIVVRN